MHSSRSQASVAAACVLTVAGHYRHRHVSILRTAHAAAGGRCRHGIDLLRAADGQLRAYRQCHVDGIIALRLEGVGPEHACQRLNQQCGEDRRTLRVHLHTHFVGIGSGAHAHVSGTVQVVPDTLREADGLVTTCGRNANADEQAVGRELVRLYNHLAVLDTAGHVHLRPVGELLGTHLRGCLLIHVEGQVDGLIDCHTAL